MMTNFKLENFLFKKILNFGNGKYVQNLGEYLILANVNFWQIFYFGQFFIFANF